MAKTMTVLETVTVPGITPQQRTVTLSSANQVASEVAVPAAKTGSLTTRTNATDGTITLDTGHGLSTGALDIFWAGGSRSQVAATITTNACAITGGSGDDLPAQGTAMTVSALTSEDNAFTGSNAVSALIYSNIGQSPNAVTDLNGYVYFTLANDTVEVTYKLTALLASLSWDGVAVATNPFAGFAIGKIKYSQGNTSARTMGAAVLHG